MDHNGVPQLHVCPTEHITSLNEFEEAQMKTDNKKFNNKKLSNKYWVHKKHNKVSC